MPPILVSEGHVEAFRIIELQSETLDGVIFLEGRIAM